MTIEHPIEVQRHEPQKRLLPGRCRLSPYLQRRAIQGSHRPPDRVSREEDTDTIEQAKQADGSLSVPRCMMNRKAPITGGDDVAIIQRQALLFL